MDDSWRFRSIGGNICPICSTSHFPFCPQPPAFDRNGFPGENLRRFPPSFDHPFHRPLQGHPFTDYRPPPLTPAPAPAPPFPLTDPDFHPSHRFLQEGFMQREGFHKRMRVEDPNIGNIPSPLVSFNRYELPPMTGTSSENDRRLSLIRDHGRHDVALHGKDRNFQGFGVGSAARSDALPPPEPSFSHRNPPLPSYEEYQNYPVGQSSQSANGFPFQERRDFERGVFETSRNQAVDPQIGNKFYERNGQYNTSSQPTQSYRHSDVQYDSSSQLPQSNRHTDSVKDSESYVSHAPIERQSLYDSQPISYPAADYASRGPYEKYYSQDHEQFQQKEKLSSMVPERPQHFHSDSHRLLSTEIHEHEGSQLFHAVRHPIENKFELHGRHTEAVQTPFEFKPSVHEDIYKPFESQAYPPVEPYSGSNITNQKDYLPMPFHSNNISIVPEMRGQVHNSQMYPPLPPQPLQGVHMEPPSANFGVMSSSTAVPPVLSCAPASTSVTMPHPYDISIFSESRPLPETKMHGESQNHSSNAFTNEMQGLPFIHQTSSKQYMEDGAQAFPFKHSLIEKQTIDACDLFKKPLRASRPDHIVVILRGLPGSGKSYLAKAIRDIEVENGANAPRIHAMDDYFMIEVDKVEDNEGPNSSSTPRGKKQVTKKVVEFCYEPEMEESYRSSMLKAFKKTLDEGIFTFIIVDDRNLRVADFAQFWAIAKRSGYEVYLLEAAYKDPAGCAARNVHGFTLDDIQKMLEQFEEAPSFYLQLDIQSLFHGDDLNEHSIKEVDMDTDDAACAEEDTHELHNRECLKMESTLLDYPLDGDFVKAGDRWDTEEDQEITGVKELESSKWSKDLDEDTEKPDGAKGTLNALSGLIQAYGKGEKSVHWGDRVDDCGFSIVALKKKSISSLVIGPGSGYNLSSNPLPEDTLEATGGTNIDSSKRRFHEQLRAERESFKAVFDRRRQRIGGLFNAEYE